MSSARVSKGWHSTRFIFYLLEFLSTKAAALQVMALQPIRDAREAMQADALMSDIRPGNLQAHVLQAGSAPQLPQQPLMHHL